MSYGLAQFGLATINSYNQAEENRKKKEEEKADKLYERGRQAVSDKREQERFDVDIAGDRLTLDGKKMDSAAKKDAFDYEATYNKSAWLEKAGDYNAAADTIVRAANQNSNIPFKVDIERDETGKVIQRTDEQGNPYYYQTIYDKETGVAVGQPTAISYDQLKDSFNQLNNAKSIDAANAAYQQKLADEIAKDERELSLYGGKKKIDVQADNIKAQRDHIYKVDEMGIKHGYTVDELGVKHGYTIDLEGIKHANAVDLSNVNSQNRIGEYVGRSDVDAGGTPIVGGPAWGSFDALIGPESGGRQVDKNGRTITSPVGAKGIAQVMPDTAKYVAKKHGIPWSDSKYKQDANYNYNLGKLYYQEQLNRYGHPALAYAAYNAGPGAVDKWIKKNPAMKNPDAMGMKNFINAIPFSETKNYVAKIHRQSSSNTVARSVPAIPKLPKGAAKSSTKQAESGQGITTPRDYNANIDKGVSKALKDVKALGVKPDGKTGATFARAAGKLKGIGQAKNYQEFLDLYGEAHEMVVSAIPEPRGKDKKLSKADKNALGEQIILTMVGASSLSNFKSMVFTVNPNTVGSKSTASNNTGGNLMLPGQQPSRAAPAKGVQSGKLASLYARGLPAVKTDPKAQENMNYLGNLNDNMDW